MSAFDWRRARRLAGELLLFIVIVAGIQAWRARDLLPADERATRVRAFVRKYRWKGPVFAIAAVNGEGCRPLVYAIQDWLDAHPASPVVPESAAGVDAAPVDPSSAP